VTARGRTFRLPIVFYSGVAVGALAVVTVELLARRSGWAWVTTLCALSALLYTVIRGMENPSKR